jgi:hypothetical protein
MTFLYVFWQVGDTFQMEVVVTGNTAIPFLAIRIF